VRLERRVEGVEDARAAGEHRDRSGERSDGHQDQRRPRGADHQRLSGVEADDGVAEGDGEEGGEDDGVDCAVQRQPLVVVDAEEAVGADDAGAVEHLQQSGDDAEDQQDHGEGDLEEDDLPQRGLAIGDWLIVHRSPFIADP